MQHFFRNQTIILSETKLGLDQTKNSIAEEQYKSVKPGSLEEL